MDFSYSDFEFLHSSTQQVIEEGLVFFLVYLEVEDAKYKNTNIQIHKYKNTVWVSQFQSVASNLQINLTCAIFLKRK